MPDGTEINQLARRIYLEHREAIELIYQHKPNFVDETKRILREAIRHQTDWSLVQEGTLFLQFRPRKWADYQSMATGTSVAIEGVAAVSVPFRSMDRTICRTCAWSCHQGSDDTWCVKNCLTPRSTTRICSHPGNTHSSGGWMVLDAMEYILDESDYDRWDDPSVPAKITDWVADFAANRFSAMNEAIVNCLQEYEPEQDGRAEPGQ